MHTKTPPASSRFIDKKDREKLTGQSDMTGWRLEKLPDDDPLQHPKRFYIGGKAYWDHQEVVDWMERARKLGSVDTSTRRPNTGDASIEANRREHDEELKVKLRQERDASHAEDAA